MKKPFVPKDELARMLTSLFERVQKATRKAMAQRQLLYISAEVQTQIDAVRAMYISVMEMLREHDLERDLQKKALIIGKLCVPQAQKAIEALNWIADELALFESTAQRATFEALEEEESEFALREQSVDPVLERIAATQLAMQSPPRRRRHARRYVGKGERRKDAEGSQGKKGKGKKGRRQHAGA